MAEGDFLSCLGSTKRSSSESGSSRLAFLLRARDDAAWSGFAFLLADEPLLVESGRFTGEAPECVLMGDAGVRVQRVAFAGDSTAPAFVSDSFVASSVVFFTPLLCCVFFAAAE